MAGTRTYPTGVTCWIAAQEPDVEAATGFYGELFGWTFRNITPPGAPAYYMAALDGADVGAVTGGRTARWTTFVATDDVDETAAEIERAGGTVLVAPRDAGTDGRTATAVDPQGAEFTISEFHEPR